MKLSGFCMEGAKELVSNYEEGGYKTRGGEVKFYPDEKGGREKVLAMLKEGGGTTSLGVVFTR